MNLVYPRQTAQTPRQETTQVIVMQGEEKLIDHLGEGKHDRSKLSDAGSIRSPSIQFQPAIRTLVIAGALEGLSANEHNEGG